MQPERAFTGVDRPVLEGVLGVVRRLGRSSSLRETLDLILDGIVRVVGFEAAAVNVATGTGEFRVEAVAGPPGVERLLGTVRPLSFWTEVLGAAEVWGELRFFGHERDQSLVDSFATWTSGRHAAPDPDAWHPDDSLLAPLYGGDGRLIGVVSVDEPRSGRHPTADQCTILELFAAEAAKAILDTHARQATDADRHEAESRWRLAFEQSPTGMAIVSPGRGLLEVNDALVELLGRPREQLLATDWSTYTHPEDVALDDLLFDELVAGARTSYQLEKRFVRGDGSMIWATVHVGSVTNRNRERTIVAQVADITERKNSADRLAYQRTHDLLTELPNRVGLAEEITRLLVRGRSVGVLFCDIDRFKAINNGLGRDAGDELLVAVGSRLTKALPTDCLVARVSSDEFAVLVPDENHSSHLHALGEAVNADLEHPVELQGMSLRISMTIGSAASTAAHRTGDDLMRDAEQALAAAKQGARGWADTYDAAAIRLPTRADLQLEQDLRAAVECGAGLDVFLQPIVNLETGDVVGAESLLRWRHPTRGLLLPDVTVPIAEQSGLIASLGLRTLALSLDAALGPWMRDRGWVAVNVSGSQLGRGQLPEAVRTALDERGLAPDHLHLEITETALAHASKQAIREVHELAEMGVSIALDDFGTGYSSLSLLRDLPISVVKIDRSFIAPIAEERRAAALVRSLVVMCDSLDIGTVAEGVETPDQRAVVSALGCEHAQGYLFGRPVDLTDVVVVEHRGRHRAPEDQPVRRPRPRPRHAI
jgi:diguanylate cyclase (GGDEF)-like protein/PAS domain S-box-containing protein